MAGDEIMITQDVMLRHHGYHPKGDRDGGANSIIDRRPRSLRDKLAGPRLEHKRSLHVMKLGLWHSDHATSWMVKSMAQQRLLSCYTIARDRAL